MKKDYKLLDTILYIDNVELGYGEGSEYKCVLKDINLIEKDVVREGHTTGQVIAVVGRSGRGKSTLFKALTGLVKPKSGQVLISELDTPDGSDAKQVEEGDVGFVDQKYTLFRHKTVEQIFNYALRNSKMSKEEKLITINRYIGEWGLEPRRKKYKNELSGGQKQRTCLVEQILSSKTYMVLDEPTASLDCHNVNDVKRSFKMIGNDNEMNTIIFSSHDINFAVEMADVVYVIGFPTIDGVKQSYSTIVGKFDLKEMGLAWQEFGIKHMDLVNDIKTLMLVS